VEPNILLSPMNICKTGKNRLLYILSHVSFYVLCVKTNRSRQEGTKEIRKEGTKRGIKREEEDRWKKNEKTKPNRKLEMCPDQKQCNIAYICSLNLW
jgi:hypothetical protein